MPGFEVFADEERKHLNDVINSGILMRFNFDDARNNHWKAEEFEKAIAQTTKTNHVHLLSSGTTALITAIRALGIGAGDEIIMPSFTFVASFEAVLFTGAIPVLVDIDETLTLDPNEIQKAITPRTKAIMPVHMCGAMANMDAIMKIAQENNLWVLEDACQAIGATYKGKYLGTIGQIGCFSFDFVKTITCGEGGAVLTNDQKLYDYCQAFSDHGHDHIGKDRGAEHHPIIGLNFRISELHAAVGLAQWSKLDNFLNQQRQIKKQFKEILSHNSSIKFRKILDEKGDNAGFLTIFLEDEALTKSVAADLKKAGIPSAYWYENNWHYVRKWDHFKNLKSDSMLYQEQRDLLPNYAEQDFSKSDEILKKTLTFPLSLRWDEAKIRSIANQINEIIHSYKTIA